MGNLSTYTRSTELGLMARDMRVKPRAAVYAEDAEGNVKVDEHGKKIVAVPARRGTTFRQALARLFSMKPLPPKVAAARDRKAERARRKPAAKIAAHHVPKYRAVARPAHSRPGCKALRTLAK